MFNRPKILVCSDFSTYSDRALKVADVIAKKTSGEIILLHVAELGFYLNCSADHVSPGEVDKRFKELVHVELMDKLNAQKVRCSTSTKEMVVFETNASKGINNTIDEYKVDLVVLGDKGATGLENFLLGSLARKTAASAAIPTLIVKQDMAPKKVAALIDGYEENDGTINNAYELSQSLGCELSVVSMIQSVPSLFSGNMLEYSSAVINALELESHKQASQIRDKVKTTLGTRNAKVVVETTNSKDLGHALAEILQSENTDIAVLKKHHKSWLEKHILGSVSARVLELYKGNVLVC